MTEVALAIAGIYFVVICICVIGFYVMIREVLK